MSWLENMGEVFTDGATTIRWTIPRFRQTPRGMGTVLWSPFFHFRGVTCYLSAYPNGSNSSNNKGWMDISCIIPYLPLGSAVHLSILDREDREILHTETEKDGARYTQPKWIRRTELEARMEEILLGGQLRIQCRVVLPGERVHGAEDGVSVADISGTNLGECSRSSSNTQPKGGDENEATNPVESPACVSCMHKGVDIPIQNFENLFVEAKDSDFVFRVKGREFPAHQFILKARIPAFEAMLTHDSLEKKEGVLNIEDCDPDVFHEFLLFVYSGCSENFSPDKVCGLYVLADKYSVQILKDMCLDFMKSSLSVHIICDVIGLATTHDEAELLKLATEFFVTNAEQILQTVKWQQFLKENPTVGNELFLKTLKILKRKSNTIVRAAIKLVF